MNSVVVNMIGEFAECAIHSILYVRHIYPAVLFEQRRFHGVTVWQSRHPDINSYIRRVVNNMKPLLEQVRFILVSLRTLQLTVTLSFVSGHDVRVCWSE